MGVTINLYSFFKMSRATRNHWAVNEVYAKQKQQFMKDIGLMSRSSKLDHTLTNTYYQARDLKSYSNNFNYVLHDKRNQIKELQTRLDEIGDRPDIDAMNEAFVKRASTSKWSSSMKYMDQIQSERKTKVLPAGVKI